MRFFLILFVCIAASAAWAQSKNVVLKWEDKPFAVSEDSSLLLPQFNTANFNYNAAEKRIQYVAVEKDQSYAAESSLQVSNVQYQTIDISKYKGINANNVPSQLNASIRTFNGRGTLYTRFQFNPVIKEGNVYKRVVSLSYQYAYQQNKALTSANSLALLKSNSVLATGEWFKFKITESGVYKIDRNFLTQLGIPATVDPRTIKIYGHGGKMLPLKNSDNQYFDLPEIAVQVIGENDGQLNDGDYVLFYGIGNKGWNAENGSHLNLYAAETYYYVTYGGQAGKRMQNFQQPTAAATTTYTYFDERVFHEQDLINVGRVSRRWFGESFSVNNQQTFTLNLEQLETSLPVSLEINIGAKSSAITNFSALLNNTNAGSVSLDAVSTNWAGSERRLTYQGNLSANNAAVTLTYNNGGVPSSIGYLDYIAIDYKKRLAGHGKQFGFRVKEASTSIGIAQYTLTNAGNINEVWDVTDPYNATRLGNSSATLIFKDNLGIVKEYQAVDGSNYYTPQTVPSGKVSNQNLKGTIFNDGDIDYLIITNNRLLSAANKLANHHKTQNGLNTKVVPLSLIYEEFSSGKQDIVAIRNFIRYVYTNASSPDKKVKYVNMFGDASYDYQDRVPNNTNAVPVFQAIDLTSSVINFSDWYSFMTDDFYGLMDEEEGRIVGQNYTGIDIAMGRMPVNTNEEANAVVDKVIQYQSRENTGRWKNTYIALSDDVDASFDKDFQEYLDQMSIDVNSVKPFINFKKIYTDAYTQEVSAGGPRYPKAKEDFINAFNAGALMINYLGHGGEYGLAQERLLESADIQSLNNDKKYPLFAILTCEFTRFDSPSSVSGGEELFLRKNAGAISLLATTRKISITNANDFTRVISNNLFNVNNISSENLTMAEALVLSKNGTGVGEKSVVFYIGDPALKLAIPKPKVELTTINGTSLADFTGSLRALDLIKLGGEVTTENGVLLADFTGELAIQIFDKEIDRVTLGNDGVQSNNMLYTFPFKTLGETIFRGNASVKNGKFEIEFVVPKDIKVALGEGKISFYALKDGQVLIDHAGSNQTVKIGGVNENAAEDNKSPEVKLYMNDESFISGGVTDPSPLFLAYLEDENGINTASGIGHDMVAILDSDENNPFIMNDYYETEPDNFRKGIVKFPFKDLKDGLHTLTFKAWDVYNNLSTSEIQFVVAKNEAVALDKVLNYPNPFVDYTEFWFEHNRPGETLLVQVQILTITGKIVKTINQTIVTDGNLSRDIIWNGRDDFGDKIGKGVYIYRLKVKSTVTGHQAEKIEKLVIL